MTAALKNLVDRGRIELPPKPCKGLMLPLSLTAQILAPVERIELPLVVLETTALPLYYTGINFNTLLPMCVLKPIHVSMSLCAMGTSNRL